MTTYCQRKAPADIPTGAYAMFAWLVFLESHAWVRKMDSDGLVYSATGTKLTNGGTGSKGFGNPLAWFRSQGPGGGPFEWCVQKSDVNNKEFRIKYNVANPINGGSPGATRVPTAAGDMVVLGGGTDAAPTFAPLLPNDGTYLIDSLAQDANGPPAGAYNCALIPYLSSSTGEAYSILAKDDDPGYGFGGASVRCALGPSWLRQLTSGMMNIGGTAPVTTLVSPAEGVSIGFNDPLVYDVVASLALADVQVNVKFQSGNWEHVYDGTSFSSKYSRYSTVAAISGGYRFTIRRTAGWPQGPTLNVRAVDTSGNLST